MGTELQVGDLTVQVVYKDIKHVHLSVHPPVGAVRIASPLRMELETLRVFAITKLEWIRQQQRRIQGQVRQTPREFIDRESHYVWGKRYLLRVEEHSAPPTVELRHSALVLRVRANTPSDQRDQLLDAWYRQQVREAVDPLLARWQPMLGVVAKGYGVRRMKTKWGTCNTLTRSLLLNSELAKKPPICLEYIVVHELVHLLEPSHNARFVGLMDQYLPGWRSHRDELNRLPVRHEEWGY